MNFYGSLAALIDQSIISLGRCGETVSRRGTDVSDRGRVQETAVRVPEGHCKNHRNHRHQLQGIVGSRGRGCCELRKCQVAQLHRSSAVPHLRWT